MRPAAHHPYTLGRTRHARYHGARRGRCRRRGDALLYRNLGRCAGGHGIGLLHFVFGHRHVSQCHCLAGGGMPCAAGAHADRDRRTVSCAGSVSRQAQRSIQSAACGAKNCRSAGHCAGGGRGAHHRQFFQVVQQGRHGRVYLRPVMSTERRAMLSLHTRRSRLHAAVATGLGALVLCASVHAAPPATWWNDIVNDRVSDVRHNLARGADPNEVDPEGLPSLMLAIRSDSWKVYDALLAHRRIDIEQQNKHGETALMYLALLGETERAHDLIERGAQVNRLGWTPLHYAASKGQTETARMLLDRGAIVNAPSPDGTTPLMMAAFSGDRETVQLLLDHGADATAVNLQKYDAADWARERRHARLADELEAVAERTQARREGRPEPEPSKPAEPEQAGSERGTSRYFDLDRFERHED